MSLTLYCGGFEGVGRGWGWGGGGGRAGEKKSCLGRRRAGVSGGGCFLAGAGGAAAPGWASPQARASSARGTKGGRGDRTRSHAARCRPAVAATAGRAARAKALTRPPCSCSPSLSARPRDWRAQHKAKALGATPRESRTVETWGQARAEREGGSRGNKKGGAAAAQHGPAGDCTAAAAHSTTPRTARLRAANARLGAQAGGLRRRLTDSKGAGGRGGQRARRERAGARTKEGTKEAVEKPTESPARGTAALPGDRRWSCRP
jgi:hypothetical protein